VKTAYYDRLEANTLVKEPYPANIVKSVGARVYAIIQLYDVLFCVFLLEVISAAIIAAFTNVLTSRTIHKYNIVEAVKAIYLYILH
jgi:hypothetical protein